MKLIVKNRKKVKLNEASVGAAIGGVANVAGFILKAFFKAALKGFYEKAILPILVQLGKNLDKSEKHIGNATGKMSKERRSDFEKDWDEQKSKIQELSKKLEELSKQPEKASTLKSKPSKLMADRLKNTAKFIQKAIKRNSDNPEVVAELKEALKNLISVYKSTAKLDYIVLINDKNRPDGLWTSVVVKNKDLADKLTDENIYKQFSQFVLAAIDPDASQPPELSLPSSGNS